MSEAEAHDTIPAPENENTPPEAAGDVETGVEMSAGEGLSFIRDGPMTRDTNDRLSPSGASFFRERPRPGFLYRRVKEYPEERADGGDREEGDGSAGGTEHDRAKGAAGGAG